MTRAAKDPAPRRMARIQQQHRWFRQQGEGLSLLRRKNMVLVMAAHGIPYLLQLLSLIPGFHE